MMVGKNNNSIETYNLIPDNSIGVELGVWKGDTSSLFVKKTKHLHLVDSWSIIPYKKSNEHESYSAYIKRYAKVVKSKNPDDFQKFYDNVYQSVKNRFKDYPVTIHRMNTDEFFLSFKEKVDWVYVDADHSKEGCLKDLRNCLKIIKSGGKIFGDDYGNKQGVVEAVDIFIKETGLPFNNFYNNQYYIEV